MVIELFNLVFMIVLFSIVIIFHKIIGRILYNLNKALGPWGVLPEKAYQYMVLFLGILFLVITIFSFFF